MSFGSGWYGRVSEREGEGEEGERGCMDYFLGPNELTGGFAISRY